MKRKPAAPVFKPYTMAQPQLLPPSLDELIEPDHLVRVVNAAIDQLDLRPLLAQYKGGGTSSYHPQMLLKVLVYAYCSKIYASRRIAAALRENIHFMWLSGGNRPDFRTINDFRGQRMKGVIDEVFAEVLQYLVEAGYVQLEHYFVDGTKIAADANQHKVVWAKRTARYQQRVREQIGELLQQIEQVNADEQAEYGEADLEERGPARGRADRLGPAQGAHRATQPAAARAAATEGRAPGQREGAEEAGDGLSAAAGEVRAADRDAGGAVELCQDRPGRHLHAHEGRPRRRAALAEAGLQRAGRHRRAVHRRVQRA